MGDINKVGWFSDFWKREFPLLLERRELSFSSLGNRVIICGTMYNELTLKMTVDLIVADNKLLNGGVVERCDCLALLWRLSYGYKIDGNPHRYLKYTRKIHDFDLIKSCIDYINTCFENKPYADGGTKKTGSQIPNASMASGIVDLLASEYGWSEEQILNTSLKRIFQYQRRIAERNIKDYVAPIPFENERIKALESLKNA